MTPPPTLQLVGHGAGRQVTLKRIEHIRVSPTDIIITHEKGPNILLDVERGYSSMNAPGLLVGRPALPRWRPHTRDCVINRIEMTRGGSSSPVCTCGQTVANLSINGAVSVSQWVVDGLRALNGKGVIDVTNEEDKNTDSLLHSDESSVSSLSSTSSPSSSLPSLSPSSSLPSLSPSSPPSPLSLFVEVSEHLVRMVTGFLTNKAQSDAHHLASMSALTNSTPNHLPSAHLLPHPSMGGTSPTSASSQSSASIPLIPLIIDPIVACCQLIQGWAIDELPTLTISPLDATAIDQQDTTSSQSNLSQSLASTWLSTRIAFLSSVLSSSVFTQTPTTSMNSTRRTLPSPISPGCSTLPPTPSFPSLLSRIRGLLLALLLRVRVYALQLRLIPHLDKVVQHGSSLTSSVSLALVGATMPSSFDTALSAREATYDWQPFAPRQQGFSSSPSDSLMTGTHKQTEPLTPTSSKLRHGGDDVLDGPDSSFFAERRTSLGDSPTSSLAPSTSSLVASPSKPTLVPKSSSVRRLFGSTPTVTAPDSSIPYSPSSLESLGLPHTSSPPPPTSSPPSSSATSLTKSKGGVSSVPSQQLLTSPSLLAMLSHPTVLRFSQESHEIATVLLQNNHLNASTRHTHFPNLDTTTHSDHSTLLYLRSLAESLVPSNPFTKPGPSDTITLALASPVLLPRYIASSISHDQSTSNTSPQSAHTAYSGCLAYSVELTRSLALLSLLRDSLERDCSTPLVYRWNCDGDSNRNSIVSSSTATTSILDLRMPTPLLCDALDLSSKLPNDTSSPLPLLSLVHSEILAVQSLAASLTDCSTKLRNATNAARSSSLNPSSSPSTSGKAHGQGIASCPTDICLPFASTFSKCLSEGMTSESNHHRIMSPLSSVQSAHSLTSSPSLGEPGQTGNPMSKAVPAALTSCPTITPCHLCSHSHPFTNTSAPLPPTPLLTVPPPSENKVSNEPLPTSSDFHHAITSTLSFAHSTSTSSPSPIVATAASFSTSTAGLFATVYTDRDNVVDSASTITTLLSSTRSALRDTLSHTSSTSSLTSSVSPTPSPSPSPSSSTVFSSVPLISSIYGLASFWNTIQLPHALPRLGDDVAKLHGNHYNEALRVHREDAQLLMSWIPVLTADGRVRSISSQLTLDDALELSAQRGTDPIDMDSHDTVELEVDHVGAPPRHKPTDSVEYQGGDRSDNHGLMPGNIDMPDDRDDEEEEEEEEETEDDEALLAEMMMRHKLTPGKAPVKGVSKTSSGQLPSSSNDKSNLPLSVNTARPVQTISAEDVALLLPSLLHIAAGLHLRTIYSSGHVDYSPTTLPSNTATTAMRPLLQGAFPASLCDAVITTLLRLHSPSPHSSPLRSPDTRSSCSTLQSTPSIPSLPYVPQHPLTDLILNLLLTSLEKQHTTSSTQQHLQLLPYLYSLAIGIVSNIAYPFTSFIVQYGLSSTYNSPSSFPPARSYSSTLESWPSPPLSRGQILLLANSRAVTSSSLPNTNRGAGSVTRDYLSILRRFLPSSSLTSLSLGNTCLGDEGMVHLALAIAGITGWHAVSNVSIRRWLDAKNTFGKLKYIYSQQRASTSNNLSMSTLPPSHPIPWKEMKEKFTLSLSSDVRLVDRMIAKLPTALIHLSLTVPPPQVDQEQGSQQTPSLSLPMATTVLTPFPSLTHLNLFGCGLTKDSVHLLGSILHLLPSLHSLNLDFCPRLGDDGIRILCRYLLPESICTFPDDEGASDRSPPTLPRTLSPPPTHNPNTTSFRAYTPVNPSAPFLRSLSLRRCGLTDASLVALRFLTIRHPSLTKINLADNLDITPSVAADALKHTHLRTHVLARLLTAKQPSSLLRKVADSFVSQVGAVTYYFIFCVFIPHLTSPLFLSIHPLCIYQLSIRTLVYLFPFLFPLLLSHFSSMVTDLCRRLCEEMQ